MKKKEKKRKKTIRIESSNKIKIRSTRSTL